MKSAFFAILGIVAFLGSLTVMGADAPAKEPPKAIAAATDLLSFERLEGMNNQGTASLEMKGARTTVAGAVATPFAVGSSLATVAGQVRLLMPEKGKSPDFASAMLGLYGKDRTQRLLAFIAFKVPGMKPEQCEIGFIAHKSIRVPAVWNQWHTIKLETQGGTARMKAWADGTAEPDWMVEEEIDSILTDIDAAGLRTYAMPVLFEGFSISGKPGPKQAKTAFGTDAQGIAGILRNDGSLEELKLRYADGWQTVEFRRDSWRGPGFGKGISLAPEAGNPLAFAGEKDGIRYRLAYAIADRGIRVAATVENAGKAEFAPEQLPLHLGIDTWMSEYPRWNNQYFPTFLRCEKASFWGYLMTPHGRILGIASPDPVGSYTIDYQQAMYAHCIHTATLDLLQKPPVPAYHPAYAPLKPGEKRTWAVALQPIDSLDAVRPALSAASQAPLLDAYRTSLEPGQPAELSILSTTPVQVTVTTPAGNAVELVVKEAGPQRFAASFADTNEYGLYQITAVNAGGRQATGSVHVHPAWSWYLQQLRLEALRLTPRADLQGGADGFSCETHYGLFGFYLAAKHFPDPAIDRKGDQILEKVMSRLYKEKDGKRFSGNSERIQNGTAMLSILVDRYQATGDLKSLEMANEFAEFVLGRQAPQGFYGGYGMHPYTSVLYPAKSIMELMEAEKPLGKKDKVWKARYDRHYASVKRAIDHLVAQGRDIKTEGGATFEDGAVSCTASQIALFALLQDDPRERTKYTAAARQFLTDHSCLARLLDPDARSHGATLRFWEAWGDVRTPAQMMLSPHGWSGWRLYAEYYLYLLTGEEPYLRETMNALGACTQLLDWPSGKLSWAFIPDPQIAAGEWHPDLTGNAKYEKKTIGQSYVPTIGEHFGRRTPGSSYLDRVEWGWCGDGTAFEIFKVMEEIAVVQAFVIERADGTLAGYNCQVALKGKTLEVTPAEAIVQRVHVNLKTPRQVRVGFAAGAVSAKCKAGTQWLEALVR